MNIKKHGARFQKIMSWMEDFFHDEITQICGTETKYTYFVMNRAEPTQIMTINNHAEWVDFYVEGNYQLIDPVIIHAMERVEDFEWDEKIRVYANLTLPKIFHESQKYKINKGHTFPIHDHKNNLATLSIFATGEDENNIRLIIKNHREQLQRLLISTHQKFLSLYEELVKNAHQHSASTLSARENEVLYWASGGKTYPEIATILGIKLSTVKFHMGNVVKKLGVSNAKHAIKLATELKIIRIPS